MAELKQLEYYLEKVVKDGASDLFIVPGSPVSEKRGNQLVPVDGQDREKLMPDTAQELVTQIYAKAGRDMEHFRDGDDDFSFAVRGIAARFRVNTYRQRGSMAAVVRLVSFEIPKPEEMHIPPKVIALANLLDGMVLVTGTAGSGKSTTQACIIDEIKKNRSCHIVTLEDPIEYVHGNNNGDNKDKPEVRSIVSQREISLDTENYASALRACMRQAPDVILLGEMRDRETIQAAMSAAETGHLVIATLHTKGAVNAVDRIVDAFPSGQQKQVRAQMSMVLRTVVSQQLLPGRKGGRIPAYEVMHVKDTPISSLIRDNKINQIDNAITQGKDWGMVSMDQYILELYQSGEIEADTALMNADNKGWMERQLEKLEKN